MSETSWTAIVFDGLIGGVVGGLLGALGAFWASVRVVRSQAKADRQLARDQIRYEAARAVIQSTIVLTTQARSFYDYVNDIHSGDSEVKLQLAVEDAQLIHMGVGSTASVVGQETLDRHRELGGALFKILEALLSGGKSIDGAHYFFMVTGVLEAINNLHNSASESLLKAYEGKADG